MLRIVLSFGIAAVGVGFLLGAAIAFDDFRTKRSWSTVEAVVVDSDLSRRTRKSDAEYELYLTFAFEVDGKRYRNRDHETGEEHTFDSRSEAEQRSAQFPPGTRLRIHYDPEDPHRSSLDAGSPAQTVEALLLGLLLMAGAVVIWRAWPKKTPVVTTRSKRAPVVRMSKERFIELVQRAEALRRRNPEGYRRRVVAMGMLGYAYLFMVLALVIGLVGLLVAPIAFGRFGGVNVKLGLFLLLFAGTLVRSLWVRFDAPTGLLASRARFPELFRHVEEVRRGIGGPTVHRVLLDTRLNASVFQIPRLGLFGWQRNHLILGLPLMQSLGTEQLRAVLAHELGHLAGGDGKQAGWIYRLRTSWWQLVEKMEESGRGSFLLIPFFRWYVPRFDAGSFVLARQQEARADELGALMSTRQTLADALIALKLADQAHDEAWRQIGKRARRSAEIDLRPHASMTATLLRPRDPAKAASTLQAALAVETSYDDTHPCLRERVEALSVAARVPPPPSRSAAQELLGDQLDPICAHFDEKWIEDNAGSWWLAHEEWREKEARREVLDARPELDPEEARERAELLEALEEEEEALQAFAALVDEHPQDMGARFSLGRLLLARDDEAGVAHLEVAMDSDHEAVLPGCELLIPWFRRRRRMEDVRRLEQRASDHSREREAARREREHIDADQRFHPHSLDAESLQQLRDDLCRDQRVTEVWIVQKELQHFPEDRLHVIGVRRTFRVEDLIPGESRRRRDTELGRLLARRVRIPDSAWLLVLNTQTKEVVRIFQSVPGARVA